MMFTVLPLEMLVICVFVTLSGVLSAFPGVLSDSEG
jgi:hypothetical protein